MNNKKLISLFLSIVMLIGMIVPISADGEDIQDIKLIPALAGLEDAQLTEIKTIADTYPKDVTELKDKKFELLCTTYGTELYVNKDEGSENYGEIYFVYPDGNGGGKVLFTHQKAANKFLYPQKPASNEDSEQDKYEKALDAFYERYKTVNYQSPHEYIASTMKYVYEYNPGKASGYVMLIDELTGAAAFLDKANGQILTTNPYDVGTSKANTAVKSELLSQIVFRYKKGVNENPYNTFDQAAKNTQVSVNRIRGGVRVEYTVGRMETRILLPMRVEKAKFEEEIVAKFTVENFPATAEMTEQQVENQVARDLKKIKAYYTLRDLDDPAYKNSTQARNAIIEQYPIIQKYDFYEFNEQDKTKPKYEIEGLIKKYTDYSFEDLQADHLLLEYEGTETNPPLFKMAIEYYLDEEGLRVRVPAKGISYNRDTFTITQLQILPYLGAGRNGETGYTFYPDGSGALVRFEDIEGTQKFISAKVYGQDYAFYAASGANKEVMRLPAYGVKRDQNFTIVEHSEQASVEYTKKVDVDGTMMDVSTNEGFKINHGIDVTSQNGEFNPEESDYTSILIDANLDLEDANDLEEELFLEAVSKHNEDNSENIITLPENKNYDGRTAFLAYMIEGDSLVDISTNHGGSVHEYHSAYATVYPEVSDTYSLASGDEWTVDVDRNYTGNYTFRIFILGEDKANYVGMANALRDYLISTGDLVKNDIDASESIPLFIENFGSIKTTQKVAGIPVDEHTPLTTFEQSKTMINELVDSGVENINVKLTGWYNGGMAHTAPSKIDVQKAIGGEDGLVALNDFASAISADSSKSAKVSIFPDIDFTYVTVDKSFDGFTDKDDAVRTVDNKIASHREYNSLYQGYVKDDILIISSGSMLGFYEKIKDKYDSFGFNTISVSTLGSDLSSDNNKDNLITREESKESVGILLSELEASGKKILVSGGNAYTYKYADMITDLPLDSSRNIYASEAIPFIAMVLHGCIEYTGTAINLDGDYDYSVLKCVENGANPYFILSYADEEVDNTSELKNFPLFSKYYSIKYNIWKEDLINTYKKLNVALKDIQDCAIVDHENLGNDIVRVEYSNGYEYILNYGSKTYNYNGVEIASLDFVRVRNGAIESFGFDEAGNVVITKA